VSAATLGPDGGGTVPFHGELQASGSGHVRLVGGCPRSRRRLRLKPEQLPFGPRPDSLPALRLGMWFTGRKGYFIIGVIGAVSTGILFGVSDHGKVARIAPLQARNQGAHGSDFGATSLQMARNEAPRAPGQNDDLVDAISQWPLRIR
jgi:hypothetical protein